MNSGNRARNSTHVRLARLPLDERKERMDSEGDTTGMASGLRQNGGGGVLGA